MKNKRFSGIMPALITPIHADGTLNRAAAEAVIEWELSHPIRGFYVNGGTGEGPVLSEKTRREMAETAVALTKGRGWIINHIGAPDTQFCRISTTNIRRRRSSIITAASPTSPACRSLSTRTACSTAAPTISCGR